MKVNVFAALNVNTQRKTPKTKINLTNIPNLTTCAKYIIWVTSKNKNKNHTTHASK